MEPKPKKKTPPPVSVRLTDEERAALENAAQGTSLSAHIRACLFGENVSVRKTRRRTPTLDEEALARVLGLLGQTRIANNLNMIAREANRGTLQWTDDTRVQVAEAYSHVRFMRNELVNALGLIESAEQ